MSKPEINVTPLIDVLLVLLIIFMVISPEKPQKFASKIPSEPTNDKSPPPPTMLVLNIDPAGKLSLNSKDLAATVMAPAAAIQTLREVFELRERNFENERTVFIKAPKGLNYGSVVKVIDAAKSAGAEPISLQIDLLDQ